MIRYARKEDAPRILQLISDLAKYEKAPHEAVATLNQIEESLFSHNPHVFCHVAEVDGNIVGAETMDEWTVYRMSGDALKKLGS